MRWKTCRYLLNRGTSRGKDEPLLDIRSAILHHEEGVDLLPSSLGLFSLELTMTGANARETILKRLLAPLKSQYDVILIDCAPTLGMFTLNSLSAADSILIPVSVNFLSIEGISQLLDTVMFIKQEINPDVIIEGIVLTMLDARTSYARGMVSLISNMVLAIMSEQKKPETERVVLQSRQISQYFSPSATPKEMETSILSMLDTAKEWRSYFPEDSTLDDVNRRMRKVLEGMKRTKSRAPER